jgi:hypothetical protein
MRGVARPPACDLDTSRLREENSSELAEQLDRVPSIREQRHGDARTGNGAQERVLPDRAAVVPDHRSPVPVVDAPAEAPVAGEGSAPAARNGDLRRLPAVESDQI